MLVQIARLRVKVERLTDENHELRTKLNQNTPCNR